MRTALIGARKTKGLSVAEVAQKVDISVSFYYKIESGLRNPTIELAKQLADIFEGDIETLFFAENLDVSSNDDHAAGLDQTGTG